MNILTVIRDLHAGKSRGITYLTLGFLLSIPLGLASLRIDRRLDVLAGYDILEYSHRALLYGVASGFLLSVTFVFLLVITIGIVRYFKSNKGFSRWLLLVLAIIHAPVTTLTIALYITSVLRVGGAILRHII